MLASQWVWQRTKSVSIPAEEQNAGRVVDYFYRMEFHITPRFFSDSNYLFFFFFCNFVVNLVLPGGCAFHNFSQNVTSFHKFSQHENRYKIVKAGEKL